MMSSIELLEVEPIVGILQEVTIRVCEEKCPLAETSMDGIWAIPHGIKLPFPKIIMGLVIDED